ncbi:MAG: MupA/Atu3671 family FMN-dependent luciferase-like monooxygenase [Planctomycetota bacterium]
MTAGRLTCWLIGSNSLLEQCGEILLRGGHEVHGVITSADALVDWARSRDLRVVDGSADARAAMAERPFDVLFAITHFERVPDDVLSLPRRAAINFHDGPLPDYAGLNAPAWALMHRETRYGITWHSMEAGIDTGSILKQVHFDVAPQETALGLNAKCYEAAIGSFGELVEDLAAGALTPVPQDKERRRYFARHRRPPAACHLDWSAPADRLEALVRALDFGHYPNPLGLPKLSTAGQLIGVTRARARADDDARSAASPGTILDVDDQVILVATGRGALALGGFVRPDGRPLTTAEATGELALAPGAVLPTLTDEAARRLTDLDRRMSASEPYWVRRLARLDPVSLPFPFVAATGDRPARAAAAPLAVPTGLAAKHPGRPLSTVLVAAFCVFLARLARRRRFDLGYRGPALRRETEDLAAWLAPQHPLDVEVRLDESFDELLDRIGRGLETLEQRAPWLRDTIARHPELHALQGVSDGQLLPVAVELDAPSGEPTLRRGAEWTLEIAEASGACRCVFDSERLSAEHAASICRGFGALLESLATAPSLPLSAHPVVAADERERQLTEWGRYASPDGGDACLHEQFAAQVRRTPTATALVCGEHELSYADLATRVAQVAAQLADLGIGPGRLVGVHLDRTLDLVVSILAVLEAGGAYVPLDPDLPAERLAFLIGDAGLAVIVTRTGLASALPASEATLLRVDDERARDAHGEPRGGGSVARPEDAAYVIYTSGSTGRPKGVVIEHRNLASFCAAMDRTIPHDPPGNWLALTSPSFDISVLELLWTLTRGFKVVLASAPDAARVRDSRAHRGMDFSLFYFSSDEGNDRGEGYRLLMEGARFADEHGFRAVWTPERHFHAFGGLYPNPAITGAAIAAITNHVEIRAGSVVLPLHHPIRVAEEWALVDNLSGGRVGISFASGWHPNDFVLAPQNHSRAKEVMFREIETVRRLWRGETVGFPGVDGAAVDVRTLPRPVQPEVPVWVTSAGNVDTFSEAGRIGANILTHLLGQTAEELEAKIRAYREARSRAGLDPSAGTVTLMLHTFVGEDEAVVRDRVFEPLRSYLGSSVALIKDHSWAFPTFGRPGDDPEDAADDVTRLGEEDREALLAHASERYLQTSGLFGTPERCLERVRKMQAIGVDEIACLIDFGIPAADVLSSLPLLDRVRKQAGELKAARDPASRGMARSGQTPGPSLAELIRVHGVTHLQCTPALARMLCADPETRQALADVSRIYVGGEAFPGDLAADLVSVAGGPVTNMYGPTEATIWSTTHVLEDTRDIAPVVPIGRPIANTRLYVLDEARQPLPVGAAGELYIAGDGVARGYLRRPELDAERFLPDTLGGVPGARMYRTGDLVRYRGDGVVEFLGRTDDQIKIRGHRIEPGEIEATLKLHDSVAECVVVGREDRPGDQRLVAYVVPAGDPPDPEELRATLTTQLPEDMLPARFVFLPRLPRTPNGKLDRRALPAPEATLAPACNAPPASDLEARLALLWQELLGLERVGVESNFFDLGGHSLLIVRLLHRLGEVTSKQVSLTDLFRFPTIRELARFLVTETDAGLVDEAAKRGRRRRQWVRHTRRGEDGT